MAMYYKARIYAEMKDYDKAILEFKKTLEVKPDFDFALSSLAVVYELKGDDDSAVGIYKKLLDKNPENAELRARLAQIYIHKHSYKDALEQFESLLKSNPDNAEAMTSMGLIYLDEKDYDKALEQFDYIFTDSMTWTDDSGKRMRLWIDPEVGTIADPQKFMDTLVDRTVRILKDEPIDIYVNPTFLPNQLSARYAELWTPARMKTIVAALKANNVAMEINTRYMIPSAAFIKLAREAGVKFTCGTNNAGAQDLGRLEYCIRMIKECGLAWQDMWVPPADGQKAIQRKPLVVSER